MAITLLDLEARLQNRLGFTSLSSMQRNMLREALNAAVGRTLSDGTPGLHRVHTLPTLGRFTPDQTVSYDPTAEGEPHIVADASLETDFYEAKIRPGDIVNLPDRQVLVHYVNSEHNGERIHIAERLDKAYTAVSITVDRRSVDLPNGGRVMEVRDAGHLDRKLLYDVMAISKSPFRTDDGVKFSQSIDVQGSGKNYLSIVPCPVSVTDFVITQAYEIDRLTAGADEFELPEGVLDVVLARAVQLYRTWTSNDQIEHVASASEVQDADDQTRNRNSGTGFFIK